MTAVLRVRHGVRLTFLLTSRKDRWVSLELVNSDGGRITDNHLGNA
ncbi:hypothetical protein [Saccharothrix sp. NRRL B-16348]|nr:hypothetical protein [Saccharothrix sp. NRRL B-16348]